VSGLARWIGIAAVIGVIAVVGFIFRDRLSGGAGDLQVGDCFDDPGAVAEVSDVQHHPCSEAHTGEVFLVSEMTGDNATYPTDDAFLEHVGTNCVPAFETYTGTTFDDNTALDIGYFHPTSEGWGDGDREVICYAYNLDGSTTTGSVKAQ
jgi:Septum formation